MQALQDHDTVIHVVDAVVAETEKFSEIAGMKRGTARRSHAFHVNAPATGNARSPSEDRRVTGSKHDVGTIDR